MRVVATLVVSVLVLGCGETPGGNGGVDSSVIADAAIQSITREQVAEACLRTSACDIKTYPRLSSCLEAYFDLFRPLGLGPVYDKIYACVNAARGDCTAMATCFGWGAACDGSYKATCEGDVAISCDLIQGRIYRLNCNHAKLTCGIKSGSTATANCTPGTCGSSYSDRCEGSRELVCGAGIIEMRECAEFGMACGQGGGKKSTYGCRGETADRCFTWGKYAYSPSCQGALALSCEGGRVHKEDCARHTMMKTACTGGQCVPAGKACTSELNRCSGNLLEACLDGTWRQYDCAALGLGDCAKNATYGANCTKKPTT